MLTTLDNTLTLSEQGVSRPLPRPDGREPPGEHDRGSGLEDDPRASRAAPGGPRPSRLSLAQLYTRRIYGDPDG
jgi:hypothetical protein